MGTGIKQGAQVAAKADVQERITLMWPALSSTISKETWNLLLHPELSHNLAMAELQRLGVDHPLVAALMQQAPQGKQAAFSLFCPSPAVP